MKIKNVRREQGYKSCVIAKKLGLKPSSYSDKENGKRKFSAREILVLCQILQIELNEIDDIK